MVGELQVDFVRKLLGRRRTFGGHMRPSARRLLVEGISSSALERKSFIISKPFEIC
jgi:hypothetical protein